MRYLLILTLSFLTLFASDAFISSTQLKKTLNDKNLIVIDVAPYSIYQQGHIEGAIHSNVSKFLDQNNTLVLLNSAQKIQKELRGLGIDQDSKVVIYSHNTEQGVLNSSFLATILLYSGFENLSILDGGYMSWAFEYQLLTSKIISKHKKIGNIEVDTQDKIFISLDDLKQDRTTTILDSRTPYIYYGSHRSKDVKAIGHIPRAKSSYYGDKFFSDGVLRKKEQLNDIFITGYGLKSYDSVIVYGDTIFSASMNFYILYKEMGFKNTKLYEASFLEWGNKKDLPTTSFRWE